MSSAAEGGPSGTCSIARLYKLAPALDTRPGFLLEFAPQDADLSILEAITDVPADRKAEAMRLLRVFKTGTND